MKVIYTKLIAILADENLFDNIHSKICANPDNEPICSTCGAEHEKGENYFTGVIPHSEQNIQICRDTLKELHILPIGLIRDIEVDNDGNCLKEIRID